MSEPRLHFLTGMTREITTFVRMTVAAGAVAAVTAILHQITEVNPTTVALSYVVVILLVATACLRIDTRVLRGTDVPDAVVSYARLHHVTEIFVMREHRSPIRSWFASAQGRHAGHGRRRSCEARAGGSRLK